MAIQPEMQRFRAGLWISMLLFGVLLAGCMKTQPNTIEGVNSMLEDTLVIAGNRYYVDAEHGDDNQDGRSESTPWKSLAKLNATAFEPGDEIYLKSGSQFTGQLKPIASGAPGKPIMLTSYGGSKKPLIAGGGVQPATVYLYNLEYWEISNLEITNYHPAVDVRSGVMVENDSGLRRHIYLRQLEIHQVNGENIDSNWGYDRTNGGIIFYMKGYSEPAYMDDVRIEDNYIHHADRSGIYFYSSWMNRHTISEGFGRWTGSTNVIVRNNVLNDIGGDGIVLVATDGGLIEHNVATYTNARSGKNNIAIWCGVSDNCVIQFNEAAYTQVREGDGEGFDIDYGGENNILQYNYSHDNEGGFVLVTSIHDVINKNAIIRYNISQNDRQKIFRIVGRSTTGAQIYNNTVYIGAHLNTKITETDGYEGPVGEALFANNLIINHGTGQYWHTSGATFRNNCYYATKTREGEPEDPFKIIDDPLVVSEGSGGMGRDSVAGYQLQADSPCIDAGMVIEGHGGSDYFGNAVPANGRPDIGAHEYGTQAEGRLNGEAPAGDGQAAASAGDGPVGDKVAVVSVSDVPVGDREAVANVNGVPVGDREAVASVNGVPVGDKEAVASVNGVLVTVQEFYHALERHQNAVFSKYATEYEGVDFWWSHLSDGRPVDVLFQQALDECVDYHLKLQLAQEAGIIEEASYKAFLNALQEENKQRQERTEAGEVIYGPEQYSETTYFAYYFLELVRRLKEHYGEADYPSFFGKRQASMAITTTLRYESLKAEFK